MTINNLTSDLHISAQDTDNNVNIKSSDNQSKSIYQPTTNTV